jgi:hypothetical protein
MSHPIFEQWLSTSTMVAAEQDLVSQGDTAIPILQALLDGSAKNGYGVPYRALGLPLRCALEVAARLGPKAKPLEPLLVMDLEAGNAAAAAALGQIGQASDQAIERLARSMVSAQPVDFNLPFEAARALMRLDVATHPAVMGVPSTSDKARAVWARVENRS